MTPFGAPPIFHLAVAVEPPLPLDPLTMRGLRVVRITGGKVTGQINGSILPGGTDWQTVAADGMIHIEARYLLELADGARIELQSRGIRAPDAAGFWSPIWLRTAAAAQDQLCRRQYLGYGRKEEGLVHIDVYALP